jgi:hypothetical protein
MRSVVQEWIDIQNQAITTESDIWIYFYEQGTLTPSKIITKRHLKTFSYRQSGSVINKVIPKKEITFEMFTYCENAPEFSIHQACCVVFKYRKKDLSGWLDCVIGSFQVADKEVKANGLTAKYTLNNYFNPHSSSHREWDIFYSDNKVMFGSNRTGLGDYNTDCTVKNLVPYYNIGNENYLKQAVGKSLGKVSILELIQMCSVCGCKTFYLGASNNNITPYNVNGYFFALTPSSSADNTYIIKQGVCYQKPEILQDEQITNITINVYENKRSGYDLLNGVNIDNFGMEIDEQNQSWEDEHHEGGYEGRTRIDPSKYWYELVDKLGDSDFDIDGSWVYGWNENETTDGVSYPYMETSISTKSFSVSGVSKGGTLTIDNELINVNYVDYVGAFLQTWCAKTEVLELYGRFDPRLELFDIINVFFDDAIYKIVVEDFDLSYNGGFSGKILGRICEKQPHTNYMAFTKVGGSGYLYLAHGQGLTNYPFEYSFDKLTWNNFTSNGIDMTSHDVVYIRGDNETLNGSSSNDYWYFEAQATLQLAVSGDIMSLRDKTLTNKTIPTEHYFHALFQNFTSLVDAKDLILSPTTLTNTCYMYMFNGCTNLVSAPKELPATTLTNSCYLSMFENCTSLVDAPNIKATSASGTSCCNRMFYGCSSLVNAPTLNASLMAEYIYLAMFENCTSLVNAPSLQATTLARGCYYAMFENCTSLVNMPNLPATTLQPYCYYEMFRGCTSLVRAKSIPATTVAEACCYSMFYGCVNLETLVALHTLTLQKWCYRRMFYNCSKIVVDETQSSGQHTYRIPDTGTGTNTGLTGLTSMFEGTGGTMNYTPVVNTTYYTTNEVV